MAKRKIKKKKGPSALRRVWSLLVDESFASLRKIVIIVIPVGLLVAGSVVGMSRLEVYVKNVATSQNIPIKVTFKGEKPLWATDELVKSVNQSCGVRPDAKLLDDDLAKQIWDSLSANSWVSEVKSVRKCYGGEIQVEYSLREPLAVMVSGNETRYIDEHGMVMSYAPVEKHLVRIDGTRQAVPIPGRVVNHEDIKAALDILHKIELVDKSLSGSIESVLPELARINISNFGGRVDPNKSHINLYTIKNTEIRWGAAIQREVEEYEGDFKTKITKLYRDYRDYGTLDSRATGIDLRDPVH